MPTGRYTGALKGRVNNYRVDGIGIVDLTTDAKLVPGAQRRLRHHRPRRRADQAAVQRRRAQLPRRQCGRAQRRRLQPRRRRHLPQPAAERAAIPHHARARAGSIRRTARSLFDADAYSTHTARCPRASPARATAPVVVLRAPRPGRRRRPGRPRSARSSAGAAPMRSPRGAAPTYGPFTADVLVRAGRAADGRRPPRACFAGIDRARPRRRRPPPGRSRARCSSPGRASTATSRSPRRAGYQRADVAARAYNATIPGMVDFTIGRAIVDAQRRPVPRGAAGRRRRPARRHALRRDRHPGGAREGRTTSAGAAPRRRC